MTRIYYDFRFDENKISPFFPTSSFLSHAQIFVRRYFLNFLVYPKASLRMEDFPMIFHKTAVNKKLEAYGWGFRSHPPAHFPSKKNAAASCTKLWFKPFVFCARSCSWAGGNEWARELFHVVHVKYGGISWLKSFFLFVCGTFVHCFGWVVFVPRSPAFSPYFQLIIHHTKSSSPFFAGCKGALCPTFFLQKRQKYNVVEGNCGAAADSVQRYSTKPKRYRNLMCKQNVESITRICA